MNPEPARQVVMITGAAGTLGRAAAAAFAAAGTQCVLVGRNRESLLARLGPPRDEDMFAASDLADASSVARTVEAVLARYGRIDALCNIAGGFQMGPPVHETVPELWRSMLQINAATVINAVAAVVPVMLKAGKGKIVNVAALAGNAGRPHMGAYSASKGAVIRLTEAMAGELRDRNINVNCVLPSILDTEQNRADMPQADPARWVAPAALADVLVFLTSAQARAIHGAAIPVVGLS